MCREKGLALAVDVFIELKKRGTVPELKFHAGGGCGPGDEPFVEEQKQKLARAGVLGDAKFSPNVSREEKIAFLQGLDVFCTPALYGEAFGLYVVEAMAAGVPVVQPNHAAFPEIVQMTGGGLIAEPNTAALADAVEELFANREQARLLARRGQESTPRHFDIAGMAEEFSNACRALAAHPSALQLS
jgi:glycosyltransferase involved in cell wall biosynthesis